MGHTRRSGRHESRREGRRESRYSVKTHHRRRRRHNGADHHGRDDGTERPPVPRDFHCHICGKTHWTVDCPRLQQHPESYSLMDALRGCPQCGQRGHSLSQCHTRKYLCRDCGGMHDTRDCAFAHVGEDWYEFLDPTTRHVYYANADESQVQWSAPTHELDTVYWHCARCQTMIPAKFRECLLCHSIRPESKASALLATDTDDDDDDSSSSSSSSSNSSSSGSSSSNSNSDSSSSDSSSSSSTSSSSTSAA